MAKKKHPTEEETNLYRSLSDIFWDKHLRMQTIDFWLNQEAILPEEREKFPEAAKAYKLKNSKLYKSLK